MKYKMFTGQSTDIEKKINEWLTPAIEIVHVTQSSLNAQLPDRTIPFTIISVFYRDKGGSEGRSVE